jgi:hypothetical protein
MHNPRPGGGDIVEMSSSASAAGEATQNERVIPHSGSLSKSSARKSAGLEEPVTTPLSAPPPRASPSSAAMHALNGLMFISRAEGTVGWEAVERRFHELAENGLLHRSKFGECIGG